MIGHAPIKVSGYSHREHCSQCGQLDAKYSGDLIIINYEIFLVESSFSVFNQKKRSLFTLLYIFKIS